MAFINLTVSGTPNIKYIVYVKMYVNRTCIKCSMFSSLGKCIHKLHYLFFQAAFGSTKYVWDLLLPKYNIEMHIGLGMVQYHICARLLTFIDEGKFHGTLFNIFTHSDITMANRQYFLASVTFLRWVKKKKNIFSSIRWLLLACWMYVFFFHISFTSYCIIRNSGNTMPDDVFGNWN